MKFFLAINFSPKDHCAHLLVRLVDRSYLVPVVVALERQNFVHRVCCGELRVGNLCHWTWVLLWLSSGCAQISKLGMRFTGERGCCNWDRSWACIESSKHLGVPPILGGCRLLLLCRKLAQARTSGVFIVLKKGRARSSLWSSRRRSNRQKIAYIISLRQARGCLWSYCCPLQGGRKWRETRPIPWRLRIRSVVCDDYRLIVSLTIVILSTSTLTCTFFRQKGSHFRGVVRALGDSTISGCSQLHGSQEISVHCYHKWANTKVARRVATTRNNLTRGCPPWICRNAVQGMLKLLK
jgi:hypothetical protein